MYAHVSPNVVSLFLWGGVKMLLAKILYLHILHKYGCCIYPSANVGKGFYIAHPVGIVIGNCTIGENFTIYQNCTVGTSKIGWDAKGYCPKIGNNVMMYANSLIVGKVNVGDDITLGANSLIIKNTTAFGVYVGSPAKRLDMSDKKNELMC